MAILIPYSEELLFSENYPHKTHCFSPYIGIGNIFEKHPDKTSDMFPYYERCFFKRGSSKSRFSFRIVKELFNQPHPLG